MADLVLEDIFGASVIFDPASRNITFNLDDLGYEQFDTSVIDITNIDSYASKILWSILDYLCRYQPADNNDPERAIYITNQGKRTAVRGGQAQFAFGLLVNGYTPDSLGVKLAPDDMIPPAVF